MILLVEQEKEKKKLLKACEKTPFGCKIGAVAEAYGLDKRFACFWIDTESDVVFCTVDGVMLLSGTVIKGEETAGFIRAVGPQAILCAVRNAEELGLTVQKSGDVLKKQMEPGAEKPLPQDEINIREIYSLLEEAGMVEEFEPFFLDLSHKLRHNTAAVFTEYAGDVLAGCGVVSSITENAVVLSALVVREEFRRKGIGTSLVKRTEKQFPGKTVYVFREKEENREFYKGLGYTKTDTWVDAAL